MVMETVKMKKIVELLNLETFKCCKLNLDTGEKKFVKVQKKSRDLQDYILWIKILFLQYTLLKMDL